MRSHQNAGFPRGGAKEHALALGGPRRASQQIHPGCARVRAKLSPGPERAEVFLDGLVMLLGEDLGGCQ